jgi:uncharacterized OB-fold protein
MKRELGIVAYRCKNCGKLHFPYHDRCLSCRGREFEQVKPEGEPRLLYVGMTLLPSWSPIREQYGEHVYGLVLNPVYS